ncbi:uncharacterized protein LOC123519047 isoform X2 [Portunus trituberculatus]|uniref:uncharacterized protein LOC123519047 isoform X2 n=1 Tax=Portunus trituberculatus TaxID=210409 RepID=UPI001E1D1C4D|nr:uncharacterized protein LOC123519047 isoform X2 [Portunus trituberculatus]XP_045136129.1 uncharacterized protein LOC123519047 isoform X2 [Portunus trituberculatus]
MAVVMKGASWSVLGGLMAAFILIIYVLPNSFPIIVVERGASQKGNPSPVTSTEAGERVSRCQIPGLESIEQYRAYLHHREITCTDMREFGGKPPAPADGKKFICLDKIFNFTPGKCLIFSFGVNNEWSFEDEMEKFGCKVYAFDPTMGKEDHQRSPNIKFYATGIAHYKGTKRIGMGNNWSEKKVDRFENLVRQAGEEGREIDYVKLDVELSEIDFLQDMLFNSPHVLAKIKQIGMEVHDGPFRDMSQTSRQQVFWPYFMLMRCAGFKLIHTRDAGGWREVVWARDF